MWPFRRRAAERPGGCRPSTAPARATGATLAPIATVQTASTDHDRRPVRGPPGDAAVAPVPPPARPPPGPRRAVRTGRRRGRPRHPPGVRAGRDPAPGRVAGHDDAGRPPAPRTTPAPGPTTAVPTSSIAGSPSRRRWSARDERLVGACAPPPSRRPARRRPAVARQRPRAPVTALDDRAHRQPPGRSRRAVARR